MALARGSRWLVQCTSWSIHVWCDRCMVCMCQQISEHQFLKPDKNMFLLLFLELLSSILMTFMHTLGISIAIVVASKEKSEKQKASCFFCCYFCQQLNGLFPLWTRIDRKMREKTKGKNELVPSHYQCIIRSLSVENLAFLAKQYNFFFFFKFCWLSKNSTITGLPDHHCD